MFRLSCVFFLVLLLTVALPAADNRAIADAAFDELLSRDFDALAKRFSPEMNAAMPSEKLPGRTWPSWSTLTRLFAAS